MNRGSDSILSVYSDARAEYTKQLCMFLVPSYFQFYIELLEKAKQTMVAEPKKALWQFQTYLNEIHDWNMEKVNHEIHTIYTNCGCDYMEDLLTAVFIAHTKVLTAIRLSSNNKKVEINVPKVEHFLFKVLCETSKLLWGSTYLFRDGITGMEKQQNYRHIEQILNEGILQAVRNLVPVKSILKDFMNQDVSDTAVEEDSDDEKELKEPKDLVVPETVSNLTETKATDTETRIEASTEVPAQVSVEVPVEVPAQVPAQVPVEVPVEVPVQVPVDASLDAKVESKNVEEPPTTINLNDKKNVTFGKYNTVFNTEHPNDSDMIIDIKDDESNDGDHIPALEIMEDDGKPLSDGIDFVNLDEPVENIHSEDYEELP